MRQGFNCATGLAVVWEMLVMYCKQRVLFSQRMFECLLGARSWTGYLSTRRQVYWTQFSKYFLHLSRLCYLHILVYRVIVSMCGSMFGAKVAKAGKYTVALKVNKLCKLLLRVPLPIAFSMKQLAI